jgi:hypothetical protein
MFCDLQDRALELQSVADALVELEYATERPEKDSAKLVEFQALLAEMHDYMNLAKAAIKGQIKEIGSELLNPQPKQTTFMDEAREFAKDLKEAGGTIEVRTP